MMPGTVWKQPKTLNGERVSPGNRARSEWILENSEWVYDCLLRLCLPGANYSMIAFLNSGDMSLRRWYINLEDPLCRTAMGFDYVDQILDVIVEPDLSSWHWKDEDELAEAVTLGVISKERATAMYAEGERVANWLQSGKSPFNGWENWRPDSAWKVPVLPVGWDKI
jgi:hypothetical protein